MPSACAILDGVIVAAMRESEALGLRFEPLSGNRCCHSGGTETKGLCSSGDWRVLGECKTTAALVRSGTVASEAETPRRGMAKIASLPRLAVGSYLVRTGYREGTLA